MKQKKSLQTRRDFFIYLNGFRNHKVSEFTNQFDHPALDLKIGKWSNIGIG